MDDFNARLGRTVRSLRVRAGMSMEKLAEEAGTDLSHISRVERGVYGPSLESAARIARALGASLDELVGEAESRMHPKARRLAIRASRLGEQSLEMATQMVRVLERWPGRRNVKKD